jgi:ABC-2 type transport system permease protein
MRRQWTILVALIRKEYQQAFRDRRMVFLLFGVPLIQLTVFSFAVDLDVTDVPLLICDQDRSAASREIAHELLNSEIFAPAGSIDDPETANRALEQGLADAALIFPPGFGADLQRGRPTTIQALIDGTNPNVAGIAQTTLLQYFGERSLALAAERISRQAAALERAAPQPEISLSTRIYYNPRLRSPLFMVPGVAATVLLIVTTILTALGITKEREVGTMEQAMVTPIRPAVLILGKSLPFALIGFIDVAGILLISNIVFHVPLHGSIPLLATATACYLMGTLGIGLLVSTVSRSQQQAVLGGFFIILPAILLSGFIAPVENMPPWLQPITLLDPVRHYVEILRASLLKDAGWQHLQRQLLALAAFGLTILTAASLRFRKRLG